MLIPDNKNILVEIKGDFDNIVVTEQKYDTKTRGICIAVSDPKYEKWLGKKVYFKSYEDDTEVTEDGKKLVFVEAKFVKGYEDGQTE